MIESLRIEGLALVERAELEFGAGLNVLTGETGAGKSIVLGALALLAGARAPSELLREGAEEGVVEAVFRTEGLPELEAALAERGLEADGHELVVRRTLAPGGRSRAWLGGRLVPVSALAELFAGRIEISSQHESQSLLRAESHGRLLDAYGGLLPARERVAQAFARLRACDEEIAALRGQAEERLRRLDFLAFQVKEIDAAGVAPGELEALAAERSRLAHAERLREEAQAAGAALAGDPSLAEGANAGDLVAAAARRIEDAARLDPALAPSAQRLAALRSELRDVAADLERYLARVEADPERLAALEERLALLERLRRKYGATEGEILGFRERAAAELATLGGSEERLAALERERAALERALGAAAAELSKGRAAAAAKLARAVEAGLHALSMRGACFEVALAPAPAPPGAPCGPAGAEAPEFLFSANRGEAPRALRRVASGGELSRVFLALKNVLRRAETGMVLVFDEVDAGIGGAVADRVGRVLGELADEHQVLCITHLPQIAARARTHLVVGKREKDGRTRTEVAQLRGAERVEEIARMAGGERVSEATRRHARELLRASAAPAR